MCECFDGSGKLGSSKTLNWVLVVHMFSWYGYHVEILRFFFLSCGNSSFDVPFLCCNVCDSVFDGKWVLCLQIQELFRGSNDLLSLAQVGLPLPFICQTRLI